MPVSLWIVIVTWTYYRSTFSGSASRCQIIILFWKFDFDTIFFCEIFDKNLFKIKNIWMFFIMNVQRKCFASQHMFWSHKLSCKNYCINHWHTIKHLRARFIFNLLHTQNQKGKKLKTLRQNNAILHKATLLGP
jgi:hypothetical protein